MVHELIDDIARLLAWKVGSPLTRPVSVECGLTRHPFRSTKSSETDPSLKTRHFVDIISEISSSMKIHKELGTILGGVHLELTGEINEDGFSVVSFHIRFLSYALKKLT